MNRMIVIIFLFLRLATPAQQHDQSIKRSVSFTFDDLPSTTSFESGHIIQTITEKLRADNVPAIGFVNEIKLYKEDKADSVQIALLEHWLDRGLELGNHSFSHISIDNVPLDQYKADILRGEKITKHLLNERGRKLRYYRHTQLRTGPTPEIKNELDDFLLTHSYIVAPITIDNNDYIFADVYARAKLKKDTAMMRTISSAYLKYMKEVVKHFEEVSRYILGYEVRQILLLHANSLNADHLQSLIQLFKDRDYKFISLDEALEDPAYQLREVSVKKGLSWLHRWTLAKGLEIREEPREPERIGELFRTYGR